MTLAHNGFLAIESPAPAVHLVRVTGDLDAATANRVLRLVDARVQLVAAGSCVTRHVLVDLSGVTSLAPGTVTVLDRAREVAEAHGLTVDLVGTSKHTVALSGRDRHMLLRFRAFPSVGVALDSV
ncbi:MAG: STAS domain-containing protein [Pseudonocardiaceae bacterium]|nr:MAG: STAS domain-containing protein [Pseudonocardiaceae bacterium]